MLCANENEIFREIEALESVKIDSIATDVTRYASYIKLDQTAKISTNRQRKRAYKRARIRTCTHSQSDERPSIISFA